MKALSKLYTANIDNVVVLFSTNLKEFAEALILIEPNADTYFTYRRKFEKNAMLDFVGQSGKKYLLQEVYNAKKSAAQKSDTASSAVNPK